MMILLDFQQRKVRTNGVNSGIGTNNVFFKQIVTGITTGSDNVN